MKKILIIFMALMLVGAVAALPDEWGRGVNEPKGEFSFVDTKESGFFSTLFSSIGLFAVRDLETSYQAGETLDLLVFSSIDTTCQDAYLTLEIYNAPINQQTSNTYVGGDSSALNSIGPGTYQTRMLYTLPSNAQSGTWSVSGYIYCSTISGPASDYNSPVHEENFEVVGQSSCSDTCDVGDSVCLTKDGYVNRYVGECSNYDSDSCDELPTSTSDMIDCEAQGKSCSNGQCVDQSVECVSNSDCSNGEQCNQGICELVETDNEPKIVEYQDPRYEIDKDTNMLSVQFFLENEGKGMAEEWILELQPESKSTGDGGLIQSIIGIDKQSECDPSYPENVHQKFKLNSGERVIIKFKMLVPDSEINSEGNSFLYPIIRKGCAVDLGEIYVAESSCTDDITGCPNNDGCYQLPYCAGKEDVNYSKIGGDITGNPLEGFTAQIEEVIGKKIGIEEKELENFVYDFGNGAIPKLEADLNSITSPVCSSTSQCEGESKCIVAREGGSDLNQLVFDIYHSAYQQYGARVISAVSWALSFKSHVDGTYGFCIITEEKEGFDLEAFFQDTFGVSSTVGIAILVGILLVIAVISKARRRN